MGKKKPKEEHTKWKQKPKLTKSLTSLCHALYEMKKVIAIWLVLVLYKFPSFQGPKTWNFLGFFVT
jgi:hypothetical protein